MSIYTAHSQKIFNALSTSRQNVDSQWAVASSREIQEQSWMNLHAVGVPIAIPRLKIPWNGKRHSIMQEISRRYARSTYM